MGVGVQLLGPPAIVVDGSSLGLPLGKTSAALYYLAFEQSWVSREDLLLLFWPDSEEAKARSNLRQLLTGIRHRAHLQGIEIERSRVRWRVPTDLQELRVAEENDVPERVVELYGGPLLQGFRLDSVPEFERWLEFEREAVHRQVREPALRYVEHLQNHHRLGEAAAVLENLLMNDPFDEHVFRLLLRVLGASGRRTEALARFETFRQLLEQELAIEPEEDTLQLVQALQAAIPMEGRSNLDLPPSALPTSGQPPRPPPLPVPATPFVGRETERRDLERTLLETNARLVSIVAAGGMGKTRLALAVAASLRAAFDDGVAFASCADISSPEQMASTLVQALGLRSLGGHLRNQVLTYLADKRMLLVLDNLEHLTDDLSLISDLLQGCPEVKLLATSRERLELSSEWIYDLRGLECPAAGAERPEAFEAVAYFVQAAERVRSGVMLDLEEVAALCRLVQGMPLALTLAATWLRVLPLSAIVSEVEGGLELLASDERDVPERHRSMRSVFDATWERLGTAEREAWAKVAWFEGGFTREAASEVAGVTLPLLMALVNRAIATVDASGRFDLHPLVQQYGRERAEASGIAGGGRDRHARYYAQRMLEMSEAFFGPRRKEIEAQVDREIANARAAWDHLLTSRDHARLNPLIVALVRYYWMIKQQFPEMLRLFQSSLPQLEVAPMSREQQIALARACLFSGPQGFDKALQIAEHHGDAFSLAVIQYMRMNDCSFTEAKELYDTGVEYCNEIADDVLLSAVTAHYGMVLTYFGHYSQGERYLRKAMAVPRRRGDDVHVAGLLTLLAQPCILSGDLERAEAYLEQAREIYRSVGEVVDFNGSYRNSARIARLRGDLERAERLVERWLDERIALGMMSDEDITLAHSEQHALLSYDRADYPAALEHARTAKSLREHARKQAPLSILLARISLRLGDIANAKVQLREAFEVVVAKEVTLQILDAAVAAAELLVVEGNDPTVAAELVAAALHHPCTSYETKLEIEALSTRLPELPDPRVVHDLAWVEATLARLLDDAGRGSGPRSLTPAPQDR